MDWDRAVLSSRRISQGGGTLDISRRKALTISGSVLTGLSLGMTPERLLAAAAQQAPQAPPPVPDHLADATLRQVPVLPLKKDGSVRE